MAWAWWRASARSAASSVAAADEAVERERSRALQAKWDAERAERDGDYWVFGGIFRPVFLEAVPDRSIEQISVDATADGVFKANVDFGNLRESAVLEAQTRRMLRDARVRELSESFATQWLRLDQLMTAKPDPKLFKGFYSGPQGKVTLHGSMLVEALLLFETVLIEDRSILDAIVQQTNRLNTTLGRNDQQKFLHDLHRWDAHLNRR